MKRIISNEDKERVNRRNQLIVGIILILLMLFSTVGFAFSFGISGNAVEEIEYNGVEFSRDVNTGYWNFNIDNNDFFTVYNPEEAIDFLKIEEMDVIQIPVNLFDTRFVRTGLIDKLAGNITEMFDFDQNKK